MSAANPKMPDSAQEPSMEEILASIRRIIADDQAPKPPEPAPSAPAPPPPEPEEEDVLDLAEVAQPVRRPEPVPFEEIDFLEEEPLPEPEPEPEPTFFEPPAFEPKAFEEERLVSKATDETVGQAFGLLSHTVLTQNSRTLEDLVKDMLRPMLRSWLDENLPHMVERLVRAEIERVTRGR
ncbi:PopZ family protein [Methylobacterium organophilum]|nr:DUF2497 domain-containing protein [Methylobacterium organophilum]